MVRSTSLQPLVFLASECFGNFNRPKWWHPIGQCHSIIHNMSGVREITPEEVYAAVRLTIAQVAAPTSGLKFGGISKIILLQAKLLRATDMMSLNDR